MIAKERMAELEDFAWEHSHGNTEYMNAVKAYGRALMNAAKAELEQQLAEREKQIVEMRDKIRCIQSVAESSIKTHGYDKQHMQNINTCKAALAATQDMKDCIICYAEPAGTFLGSVEQGKAFQATHPQAYPLFIARKP
jgi:hypothetical protein